MHGTLRAVPLAIQRSISERANEVDRNRYGRIFELRPSGLRVACVISCPSDPGI